MNQQTIALFIVALAALWLGRGVWKKYGAEAAANYFLKRGKISLAMKLKRQSRTGCSDCH